MDSQIVELRYLYERERMREIELGKTTLLLSRGFKNRIDTLVVARNRLAKAIKDHPTQRAAYSYELAVRKEKLDNAEAELDKLKLEVTQMGVSMALCSTEDTRFRFRELCKELDTQKRRARAFERGYLNWLSKRDLIPARRAYNMLPKDYNEEEDAQAIYGQLPVDEEIKEAIKFEDTALVRSASWTEPKDSTTKIDFALLNASHSTPDTSGSLKVVLEVDEEVEKQNEEARKLRGVINVE